MAATPLRVPNAEAALNGIRLDDDAALAVAGEAIAQTFSPLSDMRGSAEYRSQVSVNLLRRLAHDIGGETVEVMAL